MPELWPFPAAQEITEVLEWRTDVLQSQAGEQRIALRSCPREIVTFQHRCDALGMARAAELARMGFVGEWRVPLWHMAVQPTADVVQGATEIAVDTGVADFRAGDAVAIALDVLLADRADRTCGSRSHRGRACEADRAGRDSGPTGIGGVPAHGRGQS